MLYLQTALFYEAKPFIDVYRLKRVSAPGRFQAYECDNRRLIVSGPGPACAAAAAAHMLTRHGAGRADIFVNIGSAGSTVFNIGDIVLCHKIINAFTKKSFYPDMLYKHPFREGALSSVGRPAGDAGYELADTEGAFVYEAAQTFLPSPRIHCVKVVSDHLRPGEVTPDGLSKLMAEAAGVIAAWLDALPEPESRAPVFTEGESRLMDLISGRLSMSYAMSQKLRGVCARAKAGGLDIETILSGYSEIITQKNEGKKVFAELTGRLSEGGLFI